MNIKEIAEKAGVSVATVSYVLNKTGSVGNNTRKRVMQIVEESGYVPNRIAKGLRANKTNTIGVLAEDITSFQTPRIINGINTYMEAHGYHILLSDMALLKKTCGKYNEISDIFHCCVEESLRLFESAQVDGIIYVSFHDRDVSNLLKNIEKPLIYTYCYDESNEYHYVTYDNKIVTKQAIQFLIDNGHRKIGIIWGNRDSKPAQKRYQGYKECLEENGFALNEEYVYDGDWEYDSGLKAYEQYKKAENKPTAVFAMNDLMAMGFMKAALEDGLQLPENISIIGFDNRESSRYFYPDLTTVDLPLEEMGYESAKSLLKIIEHKKLDNGKLVLPCQFIKRNSVKEWDVK